MQQTSMFNQLFEQIKQLSPSEQFQLVQKILATLFQQAQLFTEAEVAPSTNLKNELRQLSHHEQHHLEQEFANYEQQYPLE